MNIWIRSKRHTLPVLADHRDLAQTFHVFDGRPNLKQEFHILRVLRGKFVCEELGEDGFST